MPATRRTGVKSRPLPDFYSEDLNACHIAVSGAVGQMSMAGIYNNASDGSVLRVYSLSYFASTTTGLNFEFGLGKQLPTYTADVFGPLDPRLPSAWGLPIFGTNSACLGSHRFGIDASTNTPGNYTPGWCFGICPPGYSWLVETSSSNCTLEIQLMWLITQF